MNMFVLLLIGLAGKILTTTFTINMQQLQLQQQQRREYSSNEKQQLVTKNYRKDKDPRDEEHKNNPEVPPSLWVSERSDFAGFKKLNNQMKFYSMTELKKLFKEYSSFVFLDMIFEVLKNIVVYFVRLTTSSYPSFNVIRSRSLLLDGINDIDYPRLQKSRKKYDRIRG